MRLRCARTGYVTIVYIYLLCTILKVDGSLFKLMLYFYLLLVCFYNTAGSLTLLKYRIDFDVFVFSIILFLSS